MENVNRVRAVASFGDDPSKVEVVLPIGDVRQMLSEVSTKPQFQVYGMSFRQAAGVAATPVLNTAGLCTDPQFQHRGFTVPIDHPVTGHIPAAGIPGLYSGLPKEALHYTAAPRLGQHNDAVLGGLLGLAAAEIARLQEERVVC